MTTNDPSISNFLKITSAKIWHSSFIKRENKSLLEFECVSIETQLIIRINNFSY